MTSDREIENLLYRYAELLDLGDIEGMAKLFVHADFVDPDDQVLGSGAQVVDGIYRNFIQFYPDGTPCTHHVTTNAIIEVAEDDQSATARTYFTVFQATENLPLQAIIAGRYHDQFTRIYWHWCFTRRKMLPRLQGDMTHHANQG